jgi:glycosyltransferase involved in cell wall biosynthesis
MASACVGREPSAEKPSPQLMERDVGWGRHRPQTSGIVDYLDPDCVPANEIRDAHSKDWKDAAKVQGKHDPIATAKFSDFDVTYCARGLANSGPICGCEFVKIEKFWDGGVLHLNEDILSSGTSLEVTFRRAMDLMQAGAHADADAMLSGFSEKVARAAENWQFGLNPIKPAASIVVVSYRSVAGVEPAVAAIARQARDENCEVILVDNGNDDFESIGRRYLDGARLVKSPFQTGASLGRNLGAHFATAPYLIFVDDDGIIEPGFVAGLLGAARETGAVSVRGRVVPIAEGSFKPAHYDLGQRRRPAFVDTEGASIWQRSIYLQSGGFHPLLYGHEGVDLCARLFRFHGPFAFFYEPSAVLRHDFADDSNALAAKEARHERNVAFVKSRSPSLWSIHSRISALSRDGRATYMVARHRSAPSIPEEAAPVSVLTTARNAARWIDEYTVSWKAQTQTNFQLVFVDDGSTDGTADRVERLWRGDRRFTLVRAAAKGRGAALNTALAHAVHDICLIADADDLSSPDRIIRTTEMFRRNLNLDYLSFIAFNEDNLLRIGPPLSPFIADMDVRALFGMPASFPTFAFRKRRFTHPFDEVLQGGIDCRWFKSNMATQSLNGRLVHVPIVYYRKHEGQITQLHNQRQQEIRREIIYWSFGRVLGPLSSTDCEIIDAITGGGALKLASELDAIGWIVRFLETNECLEVFDPAVVGPVLLERLAPISSAADQQASDFRQAAERHIAAGEFKLARRALRNALNVFDAKEISRRLLSAHRYPIVRYFAKSKPFHS